MPMSKLKPRQQSKLASELQELAFFESPQFRDNLVQTAGVDRRYEVFDLHGDAEPEIPHLYLSIGFYATRMALEDGDITYNYQLKRVVSRDIDPQELELQPDDWYRIDHFYGDDTDEEDTSSEDGNIDTVALKAELDKTGIKCSRYSRVDYNFDVADGSLRFSDEAGFIVDGDEYSVYQSHPFDSKPAIGDSSDTEGCSDDIILTRDYFEYVTERLQGEFARTGDIMPRGEKLREARFLVKCLRERTINL